MQALTSRENKIFDLIRRYGPISLQDVAKAAGEDSRGMQEVMKRLRRKLSKGKLITTRHEVTFYEVSDD